MVGGLVAVGMLLAHAAPIVGLLGSLAVLWVQIRRLHDFGRTGWWAGGALLAQIPLAIGLYTLFGDTETSALLGSAILAVPIVWIGAVPGDPHSNRFGVPPGQRPAAEPFS